MELDLDTFLVAVYTQVDTLYQAEGGPGRTGRPGPVPRMSDSEVLTLMLVGQWRGSSERALLRWADGQLRGWFPVLLSQSAYNRRCRALGPACARLMVRLAELLGAAAAPYEAVDTTPVPLARQCRGVRRRVFTEREAAVGRGGSDHQYYFGCALLLAVAADGPITGLVLGPANTQDRWLLDALVTWRADPAGPVWTVADIPPAARRGGGGYVGATGARWWPGSVGHAGCGVYVADRGFVGTAWQAHWRRDAGVEVVAGRSPHVAACQHGGWRQIVETVNGLLAGALHLAYPQARSIWGVVTRVVAKCAAFNLGLWCNRHFGRPSLAVDTLFPG